MAESCAQKILGPWIIGIVILVCTTVLLAFHYSDDLRQVRENRAAVFEKGLQWSGKMGKAKMQPENAGIVSATFTPPWYGKQNPDAVTGATPQPMSFNRAIEIVAPSVVGINTSGAQAQKGSGIVVHSRGYVLTNHHVVSGAKNIVVTLVYDQLIKSYPAEVVRTEPALDLALIRITASGREVFSPAPLGDSDRIYIGQQVVAIGNPFGLSQSASAGIISNTRRTLTAGDKVFNDFIQTDASINPGSSGGALVNAQAEVIGVNTAIYSPVQAFTGIGFAVPINQARNVFSGFIERVRSPFSGRAAAASGAKMRQVGFPVVGDDLHMIAGTFGITRLWVGIDVYPLGRVVAREFKVPVRHGVLVNRVFEHSPAAKAGLERGDVIYRVNNRRVKDRDMLWSFLAGKKVGDKVKITVFRNRSRKTFSVVLEPEPPNVRALLSKTPIGDAAGETGEFGIEEISWLGIDIQPVSTGEALQEFGIDPSESGVLVGEVEGIAAIDAGLQPGDLIKKVNRYEIKDIRTFKEVIRRVNPAKGVVLDIVRQGRPFYITIHPAGQDRGAWQ